MKAMILTLLLTVSTACGAAERGREKAQRLTIPCNTGHAELWTDGRIVYRRGCTPVQVPQQVRNAAAAHAAVVAAERSR